jgi:hypothetical protein
MRYLSAGERVAEHFQEYLEAILAAQQFQQSNVRTWTLLQCYAEFQFRLNGGGHCGMCKAAVRHVIPVTVCRDNGETDRYTCLCTRCYEGERAQSLKVIQEIGEARIEEGPRVYGKRSSDYSRTKSAAS